MYSHLSQHNRVPFVGKVAMRRPTMMRRFPLFRPSAAATILPTAVALLSTVSVLMGGRNLFVIGFDPLKPQFNAISCRHRSNFQHHPITNWHGISTTRTIFGFRPHHRRRSYPYTRFVSSLSSSNTNDSNKSDDPILSTDEIVFTGPEAIKSQRPTSTNSNSLQMISFYNFVNISNPIRLRDDLFDSIKDIEGLRGTIYISPEGVNSQMAIPIYYNNSKNNNIDVVVGDDDYDSTSSPLSQFCHACYVTDPHVFSFMKMSSRSNNNHTPLNLGDIVSIDTPTFDKLIVRVRDYVLRDGMSQDQEQRQQLVHYPLDWTNAGIELTPQEWHEELLQANRSLQSSSSSDDSTPLILDCRNMYESDQGAFQGAIPLNTQTFQDTWSVLDDMLSSGGNDRDDDSQQENPNDNEVDKIMSKSKRQDQPVYIYCTGGIRCVKVGAYLKQQLGYNNVKRLQHGIIGYEKWIQGGQQEREHQGGGDDDPTPNNLWNGTNFLFDKRRFHD